MNFIPYGRQNITQEDIDAVVEVLNSDFLTQGPAVSQFESALVKYTGAAHSTAVCNATAALHIACKAIGVRQSDVVWTSPNTFVASANCARYCGADIDFVDIDPKTYNLCPLALEEKLKSTNKLPKVVIPVHFAGQTCDMKAIKKLSDQYGFKIIEDASHAIGGKYLNKPIGCCEYSDMAVFSFHPVKVMTTAEGGAVMTNSAELDDKLKLYRSHGVTRDTAMMSKGSEGPWYYQQVDLGFNYRITDMQCALGLSQLKRLDSFIAKRHELMNQYNELLKELPLTLPYQDSSSYSALHLYPIQVENRKAVFELLRAAKIGVNVHYIPVHTQPDFEQFGFKGGDYPEAEKYYSRAISLPLYFDLSLKEQLYIAKQLERCVYECRSNTSAHGLNALAGESLT